MPSGSGARKYKHIIWDWNGTLLDDVDLVVDTMNCLLKRRNLKLLDVNRYRDAFRFPVKDNYISLGFDFTLESYEETTKEYVSEYYSRKKLFKLHDGTISVLDFAKYSGINQYVLSASHESELVDNIKELGIDSYFTCIAGLTDYSASSKIARGTEILNSFNIQPDSVLIVGDTLHDYEVSRDLGCDCVLVCNGHQSQQKIASGCKAKVVRSISDVVGFIESGSMS